MRMSKAEAEEVAFWVIRGVEMLKIVKNKLMRFQPGA